MEVVPHAPRWGHQTGEAEKARRAVASLFVVKPDSAAASLLTAKLMLRHEFERLP